MNNNSSDIDSPMMVDNTTSTAIAMPQSPEPTCQIKLVGMPPLGITDPSHSQGIGLASSKDALELNSRAFPALLDGEEASSKVIDWIDATKEDPFTLETFEGLIGDYLKLGKDFILARVVTMDGDGKPDENGMDLDQRKLYFSYYDAHAINKVLFRTQPEEGLLHRMKAKNPMNNMLVVGDVHYYVIRCNDPQSNPLCTVKPSTVQDVAVEPIEVSSAADEEKEQKDEKPVEESIFKSTSTVGGKRLTFTAFYYATDDDYLMRRSVRDFFKQNVAHPEDIFLFTLYGGSQPVLGDQTTFTQPLVSDPTNPHAVARSMEQAVTHFLRESQGGSNSPDRVGEAGNQTPSTPNTTSFWSRIRNSLIEPPTPVQPTAANNNNNNPTDPDEQERRRGSGAGLMDSIRQFFHRSSASRPQYQSSPFLNWGQQQSQQQQSSSQPQLSDSLLMNQSPVDQYPMNDSPRSRRRDSVVVEMPVSSRATNLRENRSLVQRFRDWVSQMPIYWVVLVCILMAGVFQVMIPAGTAWKYIPIATSLIVATVLFVVYLLSDRGGRNRNVQ